MTLKPVEVPSERDHELAMTEVSFLIDIFASTVDDMLGGATASVGRIAGRQMGKKLPIYLADPDLPAVLAAVAERLGRGFEIEVSGTGAQTRLRFGRCVVRQACALQGKKPGDSACRIFHHYLDGIVNELLRRPVRSHLEDVGEACSCTVETR